MRKKTVEGETFSPLTERQGGGIASPSLSFKEMTKDKGKRERTRAALVDATVELIAKFGPEEISISDITNMADVANGTFYNHFRTKSEIIAETAFRIVRQVSRQINEAGQSIDSPILRMAAGTRRFVRFGIEHPAWANALLRSFNYLPSVREYVTRYIGITVHLGIEGGHFKLKDDAFTVDVLMAMLFAAVHTGLNDSTVEDVESRIAEMQLRVLGVTAAEAANAAYHPLPPLPLKFVEPGPENHDDFNLDGVGLEK